MNPVRVLTPPTAMLTSRETATAAGISYRQLDYWCRNGVITPAGSTHGARDTTSPGSGRRRLFSADQVPTLRACGELALLCADTTMMAALVEVCGGIDDFPVTVAIDVEANAYPFTGNVVLDHLGPCLVVTVEAPQ